MISLVVDVAMITEGDEMILTAPYSNRKGLCGEPLAPRMLVTNDVSPFRTLVIYDVSPLHVTLDVSRDTISRSKQSS